MLPVHIRLALIAIMDHRCPILDSLQMISQNGGCLCSDLLGLRGGQVFHLPIDDDGESAVVGFGRHYSVNWANGLQKRILSLTRDGREKQGLGIALGGALRQHFRTDFCSARIHAELRIGHRAFMESLEAIRIQAFQSCDNVGPIELV
jgi:hypothetical protein